MYYIGLDIHIRHITFCIINETGQLIERGKVHTAKQIIELLQKQ